MNSADLKSLIKECLEEVLSEGERVCAWCKKKMGDAPEITGTSHGICPDCLEKMKSDIAKHKPEPADPRSILRQPDPDMSHYVGDTDRT